MRHVGELFKIVMVVTMGKDGGGGGVLVRVMSCGGCGVVCRGVGVRRVENFKSERTVNEM